jgi:hypothetical protein
MARRSTLFSFSHLNKSRCFVCGSMLKEDNRSKEHVFPQWLQNAAGLRDQQLTLLNKTSIPYRQITVPCCKSCNNGPLADLEGDVKTAFEGGFNAVRRLNKECLLQWCVKIYLGILTKEYGLLVDRRRKSKGRIVPREVLKTASLLHKFLQSVLYDFEYFGFPASIYVYKLHKYPQPNDFDFFDTTFRVDGDKGIARFRPAFALRFNGVGIICLFLDGELHKKRLVDKFYAHGSRPLHPIQFLDLVALAFENHCTLECLANYAFGKHMKTNDVRAVMVLPHGGFVFTPFNHERFAHNLYFMRTERGYCQPIEEAFARDFPPNTRRWHSFLEHPDGMPMFMTKDGKACKSQRITPRGRGRGVF